MRDYTQADKAWFVFWRTDTPVKIGTFCRMAAKLLPPPRSYTLWI